MKERALVMAAGFLVDMILGDPYGFPHPVRWMGRLIQRLEKQLRARFPVTEKGELTAGFCLVSFVLSVTFACTWMLLFLAARIQKGAALILEIMMCYQMLAAKSLVTESRNVYKAFLQKDIEEARKAVSMIVGRDTEPLSEEGIIKAAVETVAENTSDGVIAPLFYMTVGGVPLLFLYKAINTMDSMVGYCSEKYLYFGKCAAKLDDLANFIPSRIAGLLMVVCAGLLGMDRKGAWRIFKRDRYQHKSPNSAQTEAACAGALGVQLAGDAWYFGVLEKKPTIGDNLRPVEAEDIVRANHLMYGTSIMMAAICCGILWLI